MKPYKIAYEGYTSIDQDESWNEFLSHLLNSKNGIVLSMPTFFLAAEFRGDEIHVHELAGKMSDAIKLIPDDYEWIVFERRDWKFRRLRVDRLKTKNAPLAGGALFKRLK